MGETLFNHVMSRCIICPPEGTLQVPCGKVCLEHHEKQPLDMKRAGEVKKKKNYM